MYVLLNVVSTHYLEPDVKKRRQITTRATFFTQSPFNARHFCFSSIHLLYVSWYQERPETISKLTREQKERHCPQV